MSPKVSFIFILEESLRIPPSKIRIGGRDNDTLFRIIEHNTRVSDKVLSDVRSQVAALDVAEVEIHKLVETYGVEELKTYMNALVDYTEKIVRNSIRVLPDGESEFTEWNDDDGVGSGPVKLQVKLVVKDDEIVADFTGTAPQLGGRCTRTTGSLPRLPMRRCARCCRPTPPTTRASTVRSP